MIVYKGYYHFKDLSGVIIKSSILKGEGILGTIWGKELERYTIHVSKDDSLEDQVKTVLHELSHIGLEHDERVRGHMFDNYIETKEMNDLAEAEAIKFYNRKPKFLDEIRKMLRS